MTAPGAGRRSQPWRAGPLLAAAVVAVAAAGGTAAASGAATLQVTPGHGVTLLGQPLHLVIAGAPAGVPVRYAIAGANLVTGALPSNPSGQVAVIDPAGHLGTDSLAAFADSNGDGIPEPGEPVGRAQVDVRTFVQSARRLLPGGRVAVTLSSFGPGEYNLLATVPPAQIASLAKRCPSASTPSGKRCVRAGLVPYGVANVPAGGPAPQTVVLPPNAQARRVLGGRGVIHVRLAVTFTPSDGLPQETIIERVRIPERRHRHR